MNNHYNKPYYNINPNQQNLYEQIDGQINQLVNMKNQLRNNTQQPQPTAINQTFQLSPNNNGIKYANSIEDVNKETVFFDTPFFSKDLSVMWLKNASGDIKAYELNEIVQKDEKDIQIEMLMAEINELKGMIKNEQYNSNDIESEIETTSKGDDEPTRTTVEKSKSSGVSRVSTSKKK